MAETGGAEVTVTAGKEGEAADEDEAPEPSTSGVEGDLHLTSSNSHPSPVSSRHCTSLRFFGDDLRLEVSTFLDWKATLLRGLLLAKVETTGGRGAWPPTES